MLEKPDAAAPTKPSSISKVITDIVNHVQAMEAASAARGGGSDDDDDDFDDDTDDDDTEEEAVAAPAAKDKTKAAAAAVAATAKPKAHPHHNHHKKHKAPAAAAAAAVAAQPEGVRRSARIKAKKTGAQFFYSPESAPQLLVADEEEESGEDDDAYGVEISVDEEPALERTFSVSGGSFSTKRRNDDDVLNDMRRHLRSIIEELTEDAQPTHPKLDELCNCLPAASYIDLTGLPTERIEPDAERRQCALAAFLTAQLAQLCNNAPAPAVVMMMSAPNNRMEASHQLLVG
jgi:hypothetical protein